MIPEIKNAKAILFDMDGVIIDSMKYHAICWVEIFKSKGILIEEKEIFEREGIKPSELIYEMFNRDGQNIEHFSMQKILDEKIDYYWRKYDPKPFEKIYSVLEKLHDSFKLAIVSGSTKFNVNKVLTDFNLKKYFHVVIHSDLVNIGKPHPMSFIKAYEELNLSPDDCICIENAPYGIRSAKAAGIYTVAITTTLDENTLLDAGADLVIAKHEEIIELFDGVNI